MCSSGRAERRFVAGIIYGLLFVGFGIVAPVAVGLSSTLPIAFIGVLGGLALLPALQNWMATAFGGHLSLGALTAFLVTSSGISIFQIGPVFGAGFWHDDKLACRADDIARHGKQISITADRRHSPAILGKMQRL
jgi:predicted benzoate:H+ symporter BenE